jgi:hypothetical protein
MIPIVTLLAGGYSANRVDLKKLPGVIVAVNDAAVHAPRFDHCVSMDRLWTEHRAGWIEHCAHRAIVHLRNSTLSNVRYLRGLPHVKCFENSHTSTTLADDPARLDGTHSGFCALNLCFQLKPRQLFLVGFDMRRGPKGQAHWFPQYPWVTEHATSVRRLAEWSAQFATARKQLEEAGIGTYICDEGSAVTAFPRVTRTVLETTWESERLAVAS